MEGLMSADSTAGPGNDDLKAKMREALDRKRGKGPSAGGTEHKGHSRGHAEAHGPAGGKREFRRKSG
jgi:hypothetical protein